MDSCLNWYLSEPDFCIKWHSFLVLSSYDSFPMAYHLPNLASVYCGYRLSIQEQRNSLHAGIISALDWKEGSVLFNDALNTFYLRLYGVTHMVKDHSDSERGTLCCHMDYSFRLAARVLLYASSHRQDNTYHSLCYTSRGALAGTRNSSMGPPHEGSIQRPIAP